MIDLGPFLKIAASQLTPFLAGVDDFARRRADDEWAKRDELRRKAAEAYLRNLLTVGVLNRLNRSAFGAATRRIIVLPECLKDFGDHPCAKIEQRNASTCDECTPDCIVCRTVASFADSSTSVVLEPEDLTAFLADAKEKSGTLGVVGVACILTLLSGFQTTMTLKLPTQGIFLNYSSCGHHWAEPPYNTNYSLYRMAQILGKEVPELAEGSSSRGETYSLERPPASPQRFYQALDSLASRFEQEWLPLFEADIPGADIYDLSRAVLRLIVPDLITWQSA
jgi:hypothetical protein